MSNAAAMDEFKVTIIKKASAAASNWSADDDSAPGSGDAVLVTSMPEIDRQVTKIGNEGAGSETPFADVQNGEVKSEFTLEQDLYYNDLSGHIPLAMWFGQSAGSPSTPSGATSTREQVLTPARNVDGLACSVARGPTTSHGTDQPSAIVCPSALVKGFTMSGEGAGRVKLSTQWLGIDAFKDPAPTDDPRDSDITINTTRATVAAATFGMDGSTARPIMFGDCDIYIDEAGGATNFADAGGQSYKVQATSFRLNAERDIDYPVYGSQAANNPDTVSRPQLPVNRKQHVIPTLTLELPRWASDTLIARGLQNVALRVRLEFTGDQIESGFNQRLRIDMPRMILWEPKLNVNAGNTSQTHTFHAFEAPSTPTGFTSTDYLRMEIRNTKTSDLMA